MKRSKWKLNFVKSNENSLKKNYKKSKSFVYSKGINRKFYIRFYYTDKMLSIYNGKNYSKFFVDLDKVGLNVGSFSTTRRFIEHKKKKTKKK